jgi:hypothetical protein
MSSRGYPQSLFLAKSLATFLPTRRLPRLGGDELLPTVDVVGCTRKGSVDHDVYG